MNRFGGSGGRNGGRSEQAESIDEERVMLSSRVTPTPLTTRERKEAAILARMSCAVLYCSALHWAGRSSTLMGMQNCQMQIRKGRGKKVKPG